MSNKKHTSCEIIIGCIYARMGMELEQAELLNPKDWTPFKRSKDWDSLDADVVNLWENVVRIVWNTPVEKMRAWAAASNEAIEKLPEGEREGNQLLLTVHLLHKYLTDLDCTDFITKSMMKNKVDRIKMDILERVRQEGGDDLVKKSYIVADNIFRTIIGKPALTQDLREEHTRMILARLRGKASKIKYK